LSIEEWRPGHAFGDRGQKSAPVACKDVSMLPAFRVRSALIAAAAALGAVASMAYAQAQGGTDTIREAMGVAAAQGAHMHLPLVGRFVSDTGAVFILDRSGPAALFRFERSNEIWALRAMAAPGGDIVYKNDLDQPVVRVSRLGALTVFTTQRPMGAPATLQGEGAPFHPPAMSPQQLLLILFHSSQRATRAAEHPVPFNAEATPGSEFVIADASVVVADTLAQMSAIREGRPLLQRLRKVRFWVGRRTEAHFRGGILDITVDPRSGLAGRPSSGRVAKIMVEMND
jgi:hypothetical protein